MEDFRDVLLFHEKFDLPRAMTMRMMSLGATKFRMEFLVEEAEEFSEAWDDDNLVKAADALFDFVYVSCGTALFIGCPRSGPVGAEWPTFREILQSAIVNGLTLGVENLHPRLLPPGLQTTCASALKGRIDFFMNAYEAARYQEDGALNLCIHALKGCCIAAYSIGAMMHLPWEKCWRHVQNANMAKKRAETDGSDSKRGTPWDVVKPEGWIAPDAKIAMELQLAGWKIPPTLYVDNKTGKVETFENQKRGGN